MLRAFELAGDGRGRRAYVAWLEARAANDGGSIDEKAMKALRRGWYLGDPDFKDRLTALFDKPGPKKTRAAGAHQGHGEADAERLEAEALAALGLPSDRTSLGKLKKGERGKVLVAVLLRERTAVGNPWITERLCMGHHGSVSRLVVAAGNDKVMNREKKKLEKMLKCVT